MKQFYVRLPQRDTAAAQRIEVVMADYMAVQGGHLAFRNQDPRGGYPETVRVFAPGAWLEVQADVTGEPEKRVPPTTKPFREIDLDEVFDDDKAPWLRQ